MATDQLEAVLRAAQEAQPGAGDDFADRLHAELTRLAEDPVARADDGVVIEWATVERGRRRRLRPVWIVLGGAVLAAAVIAVTILIFAVRDDGRHPVDTVPERFFATSPVTIRSSWLPAAVVDDYVWFYGNGSQLSVGNPANGKVLNQFGFRDSFEVSWGDDGVWIYDEKVGVLSGVQGAKVTSAWPRPVLGASPSAMGYPLAAHGGRVWLELFDMPNPLGTEAIDEATGRTTGTWNDGYAWAHGVATDTALFVIVTHPDPTSLAPEVQRLDPATLAIRQRYPLDVGLHVLAPDPSGKVVWVVGDGDRVGRIDAVTGVMTMLGTAACPLEGSFELLPVVSPKAVYFTCAGENSSTGYVRYDIESATTSEMWPANPDTTGCSHGFVRIHGAVWSWTSCPPDPGDSDERPVLTFEELDPPA